MRSVVRPRSGHTVSPRHALTATLAAGLVLGLAACSGLEPGAPTTGGSGDASGGAAASVDELAIVVPADPGGGWDQTGRAMQQDLQGSGLVRTATVTNVGGAGGTVGLASLANTTDPHTLLVMGLVMVGAVETNESQARIEDTTPIARLTEEPLVVVVPASSPYQTLEDLVDDVVANGKSVSITGGSAGGADHILAGMLLQAADVPSAEVGGLLNYVAYSGGGESLAALLGNKVSAGISGVGEYAEQVKAGTVRALAVSGAERTDLLPDVPTMTEAGYDVELTNWRGVVAPGDLSDEDRAALELLVSEMVASDEWQATLEEKGWDDAFLVGEEFDGFLTENIAAPPRPRPAGGLAAPGPGAAPRATRHPTRRASRGRRRLRPRGRPPRLPSQDRPMPSPAPGRRRRRPSATPPTARPPGTPQAPPPPRVPGGDPASSSSPASPPPSGCSCSSTRGRSSCRARRTRSVPARSPTSWARCCSPPASCCSSPSGGGTAARRRTARTSTPTPAPTG